MRSRKYGIHPIPPSDSANFRSGNLRRTGDHTRSAAALTMLIGCSVIIVSTGASIEVITTDDDEQMCRHTTVFSSLQACQNGSQWELCKEGYPSFSGFSENVTAWQPFLATRRTAAAIKWGSQIGGSASGIMRPG